MASKPDEPKLNIAITCLLLMIQSWKQNTNKIIFNNISVYETSSLRFRSPGFLGDISKYILPDMIR